MRLVCLTVTSGCVCLLTFHLESIPALAVCSATRCIHDMCAGMRKHPLLLYGMKKTGSYQALQKFGHGLEKQLRYVFAEEVKIRPELVLSSRRRGRRRRRRSCQTLPRNLWDRSHATERPPMLFTFSDPHSGRGSWWEDLASDEPPHHHVLADILR